jgi:hypothetical protein
MGASRSVLDTSQTSSPFKSTDIGDDAGIEAFPFQSMGVLNVNVAVSVHVTLPTIPVIKIKRRDISIKNKQIDEGQFHRTLIRTLKTHLKLQRTANSDI